MDRSIKGEGQAIAMLYELMNSSSNEEVTVRKLTVFLLIVLMPLPVLCQATSDKYVSGSILAVVRHNEQGSAKGIVRYDVSVRVGDTVYVVLYTPPRGTMIVEYRVGADLPVLVGNETIKYPDLAGKTHEVPILRKRQATAED